MPEVISSIFQDISCLYFPMARQVGVPPDPFPPLYLVLQTILERVVKVVMSNGNAISPVDLVAISLWQRSCSYCPEICWKGSPPQLTC